MNDIKINNEILSDEEVKALQKELFDLKFSLLSFVFKLSIPSNSEAPNLDEKMKFMYESVSSFAKAIAKDEAESDKLLLRLDHAFDNRKS
jgi:hypothetical protein